MASLLPLLWRARAFSVGPSPFAKALISLPAVAAGNLMGMAFPLFTQQMLAALGYNWAGTLFGCIACIMLPTPFVRLVLAREIG
jgi:hypothetical protein